jgi:hypothetical protein
MYESGVPFDNVCLIPKGSDKAAPLRGGQDQSRTQQRYLQTHGNAQPPLGGGFPILIKSVRGFGQTLIQCKKRESQD